MNIYKFLPSFILGICLTSTALQADDTEIYTNPGVSPAAAPLVMFSIDYRPNLTSTYNGCSRIGSGTAGDPYCPEMQFFVDEGIVPANEGIATGNAQFHFFDAIRLALKLVLNEIDGVKIGLMFNHNAENNAEGPGHGHAANGNNRKSNGGTILMGFQLLEAPPNNTTRDLFNNKLRALDMLKPASNSPDHFWQGREMFFEFFRYLTGGDVYNGHNGWVDFESGNTRNRSTNMRCSDADPIIRLACWDGSIENHPTQGTSYISPLTAISDCTKIYTINLFFGGTNSDADSDSAIQDSAANGGTDDPTINTNDEMIAWLHGTDLGGFLATDPPGNQNVTSYFLYDGQQSGTVNDYALAGGTGAGIRIDVPPQVLIDTLVSIFNEILSVSTTFVSAALPVNAFNQADILDNVYFALFQLDPDNKPDWFGNLKRLRKDGLQLRDANNNLAIATDNRFKFDALTYWTDANGADVLAADTNAGEVVGRDGRSVNRGGAGQNIPGYLSGNPGNDNNDTGARKLFTEPNTVTNNTDNVLQAFDADSSDPNDLALASDLRSDLGVLGDADTDDLDNDGDMDDVDHALRLMRWLRGQDSRDADMDTDVTEPRRWIMGDILHSRPAVINYGSRGSYTTTHQDVRILAGTNHGALHMFRNQSNTGIALGTEDWAFLPRAALGGAKVLSLNAVGDLHPYGVDGAVTILKNDIGNDGEISGSDTVRAFFGLRRGGKSYYALNLDNPDDPKLRWTVDNTGASTSELGLTFSKPRTGKVQFGAGTAVDAVFVAGGYDVNKDNTGIGTDDTEGNAVYILNAESGAVIWKATYAATPAAPTTTEFQHAELKDSIPMDVSIVDIDADGIIDRFYLADTGGRVWRGDIPSQNVNPVLSDIRVKWALTLFADLGRHINADDANDRRFFHGVRLAPSTHDLSTLNIVVGSGDRAAPLGVTTDNKLFVIKDNYPFDAASMGAGAVIDSSNALPIVLDTDTGTTGKLGNITDNCIQENSCAGSPPDLTYGWYLNLTESGQKALANARVANGVIFFTTYLPNAGPNPGACLPKEGGGVAYAVRLDNGGAAYNTDTTNDQTNGGSCTNADGLCVTDRVFTTTDQLPPGIPSDPLLLPDGEICIGTKCYALPSGQPPETFWYQVEDLGNPN